MSYSDETLNIIFDRTGGKCHLCHKALSFSNYGKTEGRGAWEIDHSVARAKGGSDHLNNLYPACFSCNRSKGAVKSSTIRGSNGYKRAPLSRKKRKDEKAGNALIGGTVGFIGGCLLGPVGAIGGALLGGLVGHDIDPDE